MSTTTKTTKARAKKRSTTAKRSTAARKAPVAPKTRGEQVQDLAQRAVLVPVGAALSAYDAALETVTDITTQPPTRDQLEKRLSTSQKKLEKNIKTFERRGTKARTRVTREAKKTRTQVERTLRRRRTSLERAVRSNRTRIEREVVAVRRDPSAAQQRVVETLSTQLGSAVDSGRTVGQRIVTNAQERVEKIAA